MLDGNSIGNKILSEGCQTLTNATFSSFSLMEIGFNASSCLSSIRGPLNFSEQFRWFAAENRGNARSFTRLSSVVVVLEVSKFRKMIRPIATTTPKSNKPSFSSKEERNIPKPSFRNKSHSTIKTVRLPLFVHKIDDLLGHLDFVGPFTHIALLAPFGSGINSHFRSRPHQRSSVI